MQKVEPIHIGHFYFDPEDPIYADHFPGRSVVPGSLIIEAFTRAAGSAVRGQRVCCVENFRFKHFISPGRYAYRMECKTDGSMRCVLFANGKTAVTGTLRGQVQDASNPI